jgi:hypothetical protein
MYNGFLKQQNILFNVYNISLQSSGGVVNKRLVIVR